MPDQLPLTDPKATAPAAPKPKTHERLVFIELMAYWQGRISARDLMTQFAISRQHAQKAMTDYQTQCPHNLAYSPNAKAHLAQPAFKTHYITGDAEQYLNWLRTQQLQNHSSPLISAVTLPSRQVAPHIMRALIQAIQSRQRLEVDYVSLSNPNSEGRIIAPHSLTHTGLRWHVRAYCEKSQQYRDFVLSRFRGQPELLGPSNNTQHHDQAWQTPVTLILAPDSRLPPAKRAVIEHDYAMQNGQLTLTTRGCFVNYLLRDLQISTKTLELTPEAQQWVCVNLHDIKRWLFEA